MSANIFGLVYPIFKDFSALITAVAAFYGVVYSLGKQHELALKKEQREYLQRRRVVASALKAELQTALIDFKSARLTMDRSKADLQVPTPQTAGPLIKVYNALLKDIGVLDDSSIQPVVFAYSNIESASVLLIKQHAIINMEWTNNGDSRPIKIDVLERMKTVIEYSITVNEGTISSINQALLYLENSMGEATTLGLGAK
jgi:hypothetical protein